ncbi:hypothetical protein BDV36DRAFT_279048 [Aspergillus pseudocaelatus]|uniref:Zinc finger PHD-type domain-containing protein n=1 Tax=Aspergillus pseudocaelatus TaxID=1825620 RepID=A0ABQ6X2H4_9EURO|nr:hypothetical protein BDV36DRAFT_279048 [Aspergillus pseudocaelatus]
MGCRGYGLYTSIVRKWYRSFHPRALISHPDDKRTLRTVREALDKPSDLEGWMLSPCPSPIQSNLDYVYTIDHDADVFIISLWGEPDGILVPTAIRVDLTRFHEEDFSLSINHPLPRSEYLVGDSISVVNSCPYTLLLNLEFGLPTPMNELQERFFTAFVFLWRFYIDDPLTWRYTSPVFKLLCIALLRLAAWDFELCPNLDFGNVELPISFSSASSWSYPMTDIYWFHRYLVVLHEDIRPVNMRNEALMKVKSYINNLDYECNNVHMILISPCHVAFMELSHDTILASKNLPLLTSLSAKQCSPGFRALSRILTSDCWKKSQACRETWNHNLSPEILHNIVHSLQCYYATIPQMKNTVLQSFKSSIPCCGKRSNLEEQGICCSQCLSWQHMECISLQNRPLDNQTCTTLNPGQINRTSGRIIREGHPIKVGCSERLFRLRLSKPSQLRPGLRFMGNLWAGPPNLIYFTILFNGAFSGLAYGLEIRR